MRIAEKSAKAFRRNQSRRMRAGRGPNGPQKPIAPKTRESKIQQGFQGTPLVRTGHLSAPESWPIRRTHDGYAVIPPEDRIEAVRALKRRGFRFGVGREDVDEMRRIQHDELEQFRLRRLIRGREVG